MASSLQWHDRGATPTVESRPHIPWRWTLGQSSTVGHDGNPQCVEGLEIFISRICVRFSRTVIGGTLCPFLRRMYRRHRLYVRAKSPHWKPAARTSIPACCATHVHFQRPRHRPACLSTWRYPRGSLQAPYVGPYKVLHRGDKTYSIWVQGAATTVSIGCLKLAYVLHVNTESASQSVIPSIMTICSGRPVRFPDYLGVQRSQKKGGWCGRRHWLVHPTSQDILTSEHHNLMNTDIAVASASDNCKVWSVWGETDN